MLDPANPRVMKRSTIMSVRDDLGRRARRDLDKSLSIGKVLARRAHSLSSGTRAELEAWRRELQGHSLAMAESSIALLEAWDEDMRSLIEGLPTQKDLS